MLEVEISPLHVWFPSGQVNKTNRNLTSSIIRRVMGTACWVPDKPSLRWAELWRSVNGSNGQPPLWCPQVRWRDRGYHPKRRGDGAGGVQARSLALLNGWASLWGWGGWCYSGKCGGSERWPAGLSVAFAFWDVAWLVCREEIFCRRSCTSLKLHFGKGKMGLNLSVHKTGQSLLYGLNVHGKQQSRGGEPWMLASG